MSKAIWFQEFERHLNEGASYEQAGELAEASAIDRIAAQIDNARDRAKYENNAHVAEPFRSLVNMVKGGK